MITPFQFFTGILLVCIIIQQVGHEESVWTFVIRGGFIAFFAYASIQADKERNNG